MIKNERQTVTHTQGGMGMKIGENSSLSEAAAPMKYRSHMEGRDNVPYDTPTPSRPFNPLQISPFFPFLHCFIHGIKPKVSIRKLRKKLLPNKEVKTENWPFRPYPPPNTIKEYFTPILSWLIMAYLIDVTFSKHEY